MTGTATKKRLFAILFLISLVPHTTAQEELTIAYVEVYPVIVTNYLREKGRKPGFVQIEIEIAAYGPVALEVIDKNLPLIRDTIIEFIGFTEEATIKDISQRNQFRVDMKKQINKVLEKHTGFAYADDLLITRFMWD